MTFIKNTFYLTFIIAVIAFSGFVANDADAQTCFLAIEKSAPQDETQEFVFTADDAVPSEFTLADGDGEELTVVLNDTVAIVEEPVDGWELSNVTCDEDTGFEITEIQNGILVTCVEPMQELFGCTFNNIQTVRPIPTISEWGVLVIVAGLGIAALFVMLRKRRRAA